MALDTGKKQIKIQRTIGEIPYVEAKSKFSIAVDSFAEISTYVLYPNAIE